MVITLQVSHLVARWQPRVRATGAMLNRERHLFRHFKDR
jgi:hypothetical protein